MRIQYPLGFIFLHLFFDQWHLLIDKQHFD
jgi:hypothetical protein